jgi:hypothetical protein
LRRRQNPVSFPGAASKPAPSAAEKVPQSINKKPALAAAKKAPSPALQIISPFCRTIEGWKKAALHAIQGAQEGENGSNSFPMTILQITSLL